jgi:hypothetical protein
MDNVVREHLQNLPTEDEVKRTIMKMNNDKAAGITGVASNMIKTIPPASVEYLHDIKVDNWTGERDYKIWHTMLIEVLYKGNAKKSDPNTW